MGAAVRHHPLRLRESEIYAWRRLMRVVRRVLSDPNKPCVGLRGPGKAAFKSRLPVLPYSHANPFEQLVDAAQSYAAATHEIGRHIVRPKMKAAFDACLQAWPGVFDPTSEPPVHLATTIEPSWLRRKDICDVL